MKFHKDEIRNSLLEKNKTKVINSNADLASIFNRSDKNSNSGTKNKSILDNMINNYIFLLLYYINNFNQKF